MAISDNTAAEPTIIALTNTLYGCPEITTDCPISKPLVLSKKLLVSTANNGSAKNNARQIIASNKKTVCILCIIRNG